MEIVLSITEQYIRCSLSEKEARFLISGVKLPTKRVIYKDNYLLTLVIFAKHLYFILVPIWLAILTIQALF